MTLTRTELYARIIDILNSPATQQVPVTPIVPVYFRGADPNYGPFTQGPHTLKGLSWYKITNPGMGWNGAYWPTSISVSSPNKYFAMVNIDNQSAEMIVENRVTMRALWQSYASSRPQAYRIVDNTKHLIGDRPYDRWVVSPPPNNFLLNDGNPFAISVYGFCNPGDPGAIVIAAVNPKFSAFATRIQNDYQPNNLCAEAAAVNLIDYENMTNEDIGVMLTQLLVEEVVSDENAIADVVARSLLVAPVSQAVVDSVCGVIFASATPGGTVMVTTFKRVWKTVFKNPRVIDTYRLRALAQLDLSEGSDDVPLGVKILLSAIQPLSFNAYTTHANSAIVRAAKLAGSGQGKMNVEIPLVTLDALSKARVVQ